MGRYRCQQCEGIADVQGKQDIDINFDTPFISEWVVCNDCSYTIPKDTADKIDLLEALREIQVDATEKMECDPRFLLALITEIATEAITKVEK